MEKKHNYPEHSALCMEKKLFYFRYIRLIVLSPLEKHSFSQRNCIIREYTSGNLHKNWSVNFEFVLTPKSAVKSSRQTRRKFSTITNSLIVPKLPLHLLMSLSMCINIFHSSNALMANKQ